jgi:Endonuclease/Exonuclease/phosphatase family
MEKYLRKKSRIATLTALATSLLAASAIVACDSLNQESNNSGLAARDQRTQRIHALTYNTGMLSYGPVNLVPCVKERLAPQVDRLFASALAMNTTNTTPDPTIILLQEVWTEESYAAYQKRATELHWHYAPGTYGEIRNHGEMILSNKPLLNYRFHPFVRDSMADRGLLVGTVSLDRDFLTIGNVHTAYSEPDVPNPDHAVQLEQIARWIRRAGMHENILLGGDLNVGADLEFPHQAYDPAELLWQEIIMKSLPSGWHASQLPQGIVTWDRAANPLIYHPAPLISMLYADRQGSWGEMNSTLDHLFSSTSLEMDPAFRIMDQPESVTNCNRTTESGLSYLSDHFGVAVTLSLNKRP